MPIVDVVAAAGLPAAALAVTGIVAATPPSTVHAAVMPIVFRRLMTTASRRRLHREIIGLAYRYSNTIIRTCQIAVRSQGPIPPIMVWCRECWCTGT
jgi:hypothetical protein